MVEYDALTGVRNPPSWYQASVGFDIQLGFLDRKKQINGIHRTKEINGEDATVLPLHTHSMLGIEPKTT